MKNNFDLRKFLAENKSVKVEEIQETEQTVDEGIFDKITQLIDKAMGIDKFNECIHSNWEGEECQAIKEKMHLDASMAVDPIAGPSTLEETREEELVREVKNLLDS